MTREHLKRSTADGNTALSMARAAWGTAAPEWIAALARACDGSTQTAVAKRLNVSSAMVNTVLKNNYAGRMDKIEARVRGELMNERVACPVLGDITTRKCIDEQGRPYSATNELRVELRRACKVCPNNITRAAA